MKNIVGQVASKEDFYPRTKEVENIMRNLAAGANLQISAPRRVGKSSILVYLKDNPIPGYYFIYVDVESARSLEDFYRKIYKELLKSQLLGGNKKIWQQIKDGTNHFLRRLKSVKVGGVGELELVEAESTDYEDELLNFLSGIDLGQEKLILLIDEFPEVLLNIVEDEQGGIRLARKFLQSNRSLRNNDGLRGKVLFVYTGSSSLNRTAESLQSTELINDVASIAVAPLKKEQAADLVTQILQEYGYTIGEPELAYLIAKVEWLIPFFLQLSIHEIINVVDIGGLINSSAIDEALTNIVRQRNDQHFQHYAKRLARIFKPETLKFVRTVLNDLAQKTHLTKNEIMNMAQPLVEEAEARHAISLLLEDGYIVDCEENSASFKFNSSILKTWWLRHEC